jgi:hypothetical protein
VYYLDK